MGQDNRAYSAIIFGWIPDRPVSVVRASQPTRPGADFKAVRTAIGTALRSIHSHVLNEPLPEKIVEMLRQLDQQLRQLDEPEDTDDM
jgi:hypothetical protein